MRLLTNNTLKNVKSRVSGFFIYAAGFISQMMKLRSGMVFMACVCLFVMGVILVKASVFSGTIDAKAYASAGLGAGEIADAADVPKSYRRQLMRSLYKDSENLYQLSHYEAQSVFGTSEFIRRDDPTVIWQYRTDACVLDIYFRAQNPGALGKIVHYEMRSRRDGDALDDGDCMASLLKKNSGPQMVSVNAFYKSVLR